MNTLPSLVKAALDKLPSLDPYQITSFGEFIKMMGLQYDETTNMYKMSGTFDSLLKADEKLIFISEIMKRFISSERELFKIRIAKEQRAMKEKYDVQKKKDKKCIKKLSKEKKQLKKARRLLQQKCKKLQKKDKLIAPKPVSEETTHYLTVTKLKESNMYRLGRVQKRHIKARLTKIAKDEKLTYEEVLERTELFSGLPHSIDSASNLRKFLRRNRFRVDGQIQKFEWKESEEKLYELIGLFLNREVKNPLPDAEKLLNNRLITEFYKTDK